MITYRPCPSCEADSARALTKYSTEDWQIGACDTCDFVFLRNPPSYVALEEEFAWEKTYEAKKEASVGSTRLSPLGRWFKRNLPYFGRNRSAKYARWFQNGKVLDIGCGARSHVPEPMTPFGIELSRSLHEQADAYMRARGGYCLFGAGAEAIWDFDENQFDGILMHSYLEHETQVLHVLRGAYQTLKPTGKLFIRVPNYGSLNRRVVGKTWCGFRHPDHVNYFTTRTLRAVAAKAGFDLAITNPLTLPIDDNINALLSPKPLN